MDSQSTPLLLPTYKGRVESTLDALVLFEAVLSGRYPHCPRRPHDRERQDLIQSGNVFIYEEHASGIKRWTDGITWSPSRILNNFLIYRELVKPFPPGEKKRALKKKKPSPGAIVKTEPSSHHSKLSGYMEAGLEQSIGGKVDERALVGSLIDSYPFKDGGLVKKTISLSFHGVTHHLVSYYSVDHVKRLVRPTEDQNLRGVHPRYEFMHYNFRFPMQEPVSIPEPEVALSTTYGTTYGSHQGSFSNGTTLLHQAMGHGDLQISMSNAQHSSLPAFAWPSRETPLNNYATGPPPHTSYQQVGMPQHQLPHHPVPHHQVPQHQLAYQVSQAPPYLAQHSYYMSQNQTVPQTLPPTVPQTVAPNAHPSTFPMPSVAPMPSDADSEQDPNGYTLEDDSEWNTFNQNMGGNGHLGGNGNMGGNGNVRMY